MSESLDIRARLTATNDMSPTIQKILADFRKFESVVTRLNSKFSTMGRAGMQSFDAFGRSAKSAADQMRGLGNIADRVAASWSKADRDRERSASRMYATLMRDERQYQSLLAKRGSVGVSSSRGRGTSVGRIAGGTFLGVGAASAVRQLGNDVISMERNIGRSIAAAFRERIKISKAETQAEVFGDLSGADAKKLRKDYLDRLGIKFGTGVEGTLGVATELSKAGISRKVLGDATELALKAKMAMDISEKETAELFGGLASFIAFDKNRYASISNSIAISNKNSKASGTQIIEGMKRGLSALAVTGGKLTPEQLAGLVGTAIDVGIRPGKSGNFLSQFIGAVGSADTMRGQKAKDMSEAASRLGFGGRAQMALSMRNHPLESIYKILDGLAKLPEKLRIRVAKDLGGNQWFDEILSMVLAKDKLRQIEEDIATDRGFLDKAAAKAISSMGGARASVIATAKLAQERAGAGFDRMWMQISAAILRRADSFDFSSITSHVEAWTDGALQGFGLRDWGQAVDWLTDQFNSGTIETWKAWGRGFASGIKSWGESLLSAFNIVKRLSGTGNDPESTGKLVANLTLLATSMAVINPMMLLLAGTMAIITRPFGLFIASVYALHSALDWIADRMFSAFVSVVDAIKDVAVSIINKIRGWVGMGPIGGGSNHGASGSWDDSGSIQKQSFLGPSKAASASFQKASYTTGGIISPTSIPNFNGAGGSAADGLNRSAFERKFSGTPLAGKYDAIVAAARANGIPPALLASIVAHETGNGVVLSGNNVAGIMDPATGMSRKAKFATLDAGISKTAETVAKNYRRAGGDLDKMGSIYAPVGAANDQRGLNGGWSAGVRKNMGQLSSTGSAPTGDAVAWSRQYLGMNDYSDVRILASALGGDVRGRSNAWCARFVNHALAAAGGHGTGSNVANSFQHYGNAVDPSKIMRNDVVLMTHGRGYNQPGGHVGLATGESRMHNGHLQVRMIAGNDSDSVRERWVDVDKNLMVRHGIANVPTPSQAIENVPPPRSPSGVAGGVPQAGGGGGPVTIHVHGGSHDPEAIATLVQRRIDESMNWRTHDTASEYT